MTSTVLCTKCNATFQAVSNSPPTYIRRERLREVNGAPSSTEASRILHSLEICKDDLLRYDEEIARVSAVLAELKEKRSVLQEHIQEQHGLLSPSRKVPMEVLTEIFAAVCGEYGLEILFRGVVFPHALTLSHVCSSWRNVTLSFTSLWSGIRLDLGSIKRGLRHPFRIVVRLYMLRSKQFGLNLRFDAATLEASGRRHHACPEHWSGEIVQMLLLDGARWRRVVFTANDYFAAKYLQGMPSAFENLEQLVLGGGASYRGSSEGSSRSLLERIASQAPKLHDVVLVAAKTTTLPFRFHELTSITLESDHRYAVERIDGVLHRASRLEQFSVDIDISDFRIPAVVASPAKIRSNSLKNLTLTITKSLLLSSRIIATLNLPSLTVLKLSIDSFWNSDSDRSEWLHCFKAMLLQSGCRLEAFELASGDLFDTEAVLQILSWMPALTTVSLEMGCKSIPSSFFTQIALSSSAISGSPYSNPPIMPRLENLQITVADLYVREVTAELPDPEAIVFMIESRQTILSVQDTRLESHWGRAVVPADTQVLTHLLTNFRLDAPARSSSDSERQWAQRLRSLMTTRLEDYRKESSTRKRLTHTLNLESCSNLRFYSCCICSVWIVALEDIRCCLFMRTAGGKPNVLS
ncbi:hypothetical protein D9758_004742 [Tetrapyrgos nigripes]|uniref:F-box domain-containing protein n=1 Tax=Tetrapyrgos nigripes TaxID=182062 RepID=A0A8H5G635_9AGAR|nr:hypothetical protein D9758_004742 [Tetrapyrgos nigripes]